MAGAIDTRNPRGVPPCADDGGGPRDGRLGRPQASARDPPGGAMSGNPPPSVVIVGGGFAGIGCAKELAKHDVPVTLLDRNNYHQFQPLLYQVATAELATTDIARPLRGIFHRDSTVLVKQLAVTEIDPATRTVTTADGQTFTGDHLVVAAGSRPNFFHTPGAEQHAFPLYTVDDATRLRTRLIEVFEAADNDPARIADGALNIVI